MGPAASLTFLSAADDQRVDARPAALDEHPDTLGPTELVGAQCEQVDVRREVAQVEPARRLHGVGVNERTRSVPTDDLGRGGDVGDGADLVVDGHDADDGDVTPGRRMPIEHVGQGIQIDPREAVDRHDVAAERLDHVQHRVMLGRRAHRDATGATDRAEDRRVVALGSATGEHDLVRADPEHVGHVVARLVDRSTGLAGEAMGSGWVGVHAGEVRQHRLDGFGPHRRGRRVVEVDERVGHRSRLCTTRPPGGPGIPGPAHGGAGTVVARPGPLRRW